MESPSTTHTHTRALGWLVDVAVATTHSRVTARDPLSGLSIDSTPGLQGAPKT